MYFWLCFSMVNIVNGHLRMNAALYDFIKTNILYYHTESILDNNRMKILFRQFWIRKICFRKETDIVRFDTKSYRSPVISFPWRNVLSPEMFSKSSYPQAKFTSIFDSNVLVSFSSKIPSIIIISNIFPLCIADLCCYENVLF